MAKPGPPPWRSPGGPWPSRTIDPPSGALRNQKCLICTIDPPPWGLGLAPPPRGLSKNSGPCLPDYRPSGFPGYKCQQLTGIQGSQSVQAYEDIRTSAYQTASLQAQQLTRSQGFLTPAKFPNKAASKACISFVNPLPYGSPRRQRYAHHDEHISDQ